MNEMCVPELAAPDHYPRLLDGRIVPVIEITA
jgi:hypothetical protein